MPVKAGGSSFCCSGCFLAHHLLGRGLAGGTSGPADGLLARLVVSAFLAMGVMVFSLSLYGLGASVGDESSRAFRGLARMGALLFALPVLFLLWLPLFDAVVRLGRWLSADALVLAGTAAAFGASLWSTLRDQPHVWFDTATMVLVLVTLGRWLDARARERATERLRVLSRERVPAVARLESGREQRVDVESLAVGDRVRLRPGDTLPVDGVVEEGSSFVDASALSGEERPFSARAGSTVLAGSRLVDGTLVVRVSAAVGERVRDEIDRVLEQALGARPRLVRAADAAARLFLPAVLALALVTAFVRWRAAGAEDALSAALAVVLIACPCALGLATPLAFWCALGEAWRRGILVRDAEVFERAARVRRVLFDKTGTLTRSELELVAVEPGPGRSEDEVLEVAAALEAGSEHPMARALRARLPARSSCGPPVAAASAFRALPGVGVEGLVDGRRFRLVRADEGEESETSDAELIGPDGRWARLRFAGALRPEAREALAGLRRLGVEVGVLTGDAPGPARALARELGVAVEARLLPADKARRAGAAAAATLFVGDGLNDAPAIASAGVGVSMGHASATCLDSASVNLLQADLRRVPELLALARRATGIARANLAWAFGYNAIGLWFAARGELSPIFAASAMVVSSLFVVLNSRRLATSGPVPGARDASVPTLLRGAASAAS